MNYNLLVENRRSTREFHDDPVSDAELNEISTYFKTECQSLHPEIRTDLLLFGTDVQEDLEGAAGYKNYLIGAPHYMVLLSQDLPFSARNAGYVMEDMVLKLTEMELDTCWLTFHDKDQVKEALEIKEDLQVMALVAFGHGKKSLRHLIVNARSMSDVSVQVKNQYLAPKKSVSSVVFLNSWGCHDGVEEVMDCYEDVLWRAFYSATLAPSYLNRQPYAFILCKDRIYFITTPDKFTDPFNMELGLGIVMLHFSCIATQLISQLKWLPGEDLDTLNLPPEYHVAAVCLL